MPERAEDAVPHSGENGRQAEIELLRREIRTAHEAADINAQLVVKQFEETEKLLHRFQVANSQRQAVLEAASKVAIIAADLEGKVTLFNSGAERMLGYSRDDVVGRLSAAALFVKDEMLDRAERLSADLGRRVETKEVLLELAHQGIAQEEEWTCVRKDDTRFPAGMSVTPLLDAEGGPAGFLCAAMDISERKSAETELKRAKEEAETANRTKSYFLANMSHELRTPLNAIIGYSELLQEEVEDVGRKEFIPDLQKILSAAKHLLSLINDVLDLSKIEAGKMELYLEEFDAGEMIDEVVSMIRPMVEKNSNSLKIDKPRALGTVRADLTRIRQVLFNLLSNSCKFTEKGTITLKASRRVENGSEWLALRVSDTGVGITEEQRSKLFQAFTQADASTTRKFGGTGLGLVISRNVCRMMGGDITLDSAPGEGSVFTMRVPTEVVAKKRDATRVEDHAKKEGGPSTILVIDDDPTVHDLMRRTLGKEGFSVVTAGDGAEGVLLAKKIRPCVVILDVLMPKMDGWSVLKELKSSPDTADMPVIMLTIIDSKEMGFSLGASDYIMKPVDRGHLARVVRKYCGKDTAAPILVVEDEPVTRQMMATTLRRAGWNVAEAANGKAALELASETKPGLILLDLMMPEMDGFEFLDEFRKTPHWPSTPIIVITAKDLTDDDRLRLDGFVERIIEKGAWSKTALLDEVRKLVQGHLRCARKEEADG
ncbi:response regulator [Elusimicrobiota bacterium]